VLFELLLPLLQQEVFITDTEIAKIAALAIAAAILAT
jgi:hypothetical protein